MPRREINPDKFGGPYRVLKTPADVEAALANERAQLRFIYDTIIQENDDPAAVAAAKVKLAELAALEARLAGKKAGRTGPSSHHQPDRHDQPERPASPKAVAGRKTGSP